MIQTILRARDFGTQLAVGKKWEQYCDGWAKASGWFVSPKYTANTWGPPRVECEKVKLTLADLDASKGGRRVWLECKRKKHMRKYPATGWELRVHLDYLRLVKESGTPMVFLVCDEFKPHAPEFYAASTKRLQDHVFRSKIPIEGKPHILFRYPEGFVPFSPMDSLDEVLRRDGYVL